MWPAAVVRRVVSSRTVVKDGHVAVACAVPPARDVQPAAAEARAVLEEQLVEVGVTYQELEPLTGDLLGGYAEVGGLAQQVLRAAHAAYGVVQCRRAVAAGDADGRAVVAAQGFEHFAAQVLHGQQLLVVGFVTDAEALGGDAAGELAQPEVWRQAQIGIIIMLVIHCFVFLG